MLESRRSRLRRRSVAGAVAILMLALSTPLVAQSAVEGRVIDAASQRPVVAAEVRVVGAASDTALVRTDANGAWRLLLRRAGAYRVRVRAPGFLPASADLRVSDGTPVRSEIALRSAVLPLDQVVITAARRAQRLGDAVATVELVSRADLEQTGASDLASAITEQTGIVLQGGHPAGAGAMLQGFGSERVLVLLDGQPVAGRLSGVFDLSRLPVAMVERVEVVKGAQSTLYGNEAMGGVINVITRTPARDDAALALGVLAGTQQRRDLNASATFGRGAFAFGADIGRRGTATAPGVSSDAGALAQRLDGAFRARWSPDSARHVEASVLALDERQRWRSGTFYAFGDNTQLNARLQGGVTRGVHRYSMGAWSSLYDHRSRASTSALPVAGDTGQRQQQRVHQAELGYSARLGARLTLDAGTQVRLDEIETERVPGGLRSLTSVEPFAQVELSPATWLTLLPGVRYSHSSKWGDAVTPRFSARSRLTDRLTLRASIGDGFRAPDFKELFMFFQNTSADYAVLGNPDLRPEHSRNAMLGAEFVFAGSLSYVRAQLFHNAFRDFIETRVITQPGEPPVYRYENVDDGSTRGADLEAGADLRVLGTQRTLRIEGSLSLLATRDDATGRPLLGRPGRSARLTVATPLPIGMRGSLTALHTGRTPMERDDATGVITSERDAFTRLDLRLTSGPRLAGVELALGVDNVLDARPAEWAGFTGRHLYVGASWTHTLTRTAKIAR